MCISRFFFFFFYFIPLWKLANSDSRVHVGAALEGRLKKENRKKKNQVKHSGAVAFGVKHMLRRHKELIESGARVVCLWIIEHVKQFKSLSGSESVIMSPFLFLPHPLLALLPFFIFLSWTADELAVNTFGKQEKPDWVLWWSRRPTCLHWSQFCAAHGGGTDDAFVHFMALSVFPLH